MTARRRALASLLAAAVVGSFAVAFAAEPIDAIRFSGWGAHAIAQREQRPYFLPRAELVALPVAPPPANSDPATREELAELLRLQHARTRDDLRAIERHKTFDGLLAAFFEVLGRKPSTAPKTMALLRHVDTDAMVAVFAAKHRFERARPHQLEPRLRPALPVPSHPAYPSGHAIQGFVMARVLASLAPERRGTLVALGETVGREREIAGLHYPSDSAASRALGQALMEKLESDPRFKGELAAAVSEWTKAP